MPTITIEATLTHRGQNRRQFLGDQSLPALPLKGWFVRLFGNEYEVGRGPLLADPATRESDVFRNFKSISQYNTAVTAFTSATGWSEI